MSSRSNVIAFVLGAVVALGVHWVAQKKHWIEDEGERRLARHYQKSGNLMSLEQLQAKALEAKPGRITGMDFEEKGERLTYEFDILDAQGAFWEVEVNARTGELVRVKQEHADD